MFQMEHLFCHRGIVAEMSEEQSEQTEQEPTWLKVEVPGELHRQLKVEAARSGMSLKSLVTRTLSEWVEWKENGQAGPG